MDKDKGLSKSEKTEAVEAVASEGDIAKTLVKLLNGEAEVQVYKYKNLVNDMRKQMESLEVALKDVKDSENYAEAIARTKEELEKAEKELVHGNLTPITYREIQLVKMGIAEAQLEAKKMGFDLDVQLFASIREQRALTVFFTLKKLDDKKTRYFSKLEEVAVIPDECIDELFDLYMKHIGLTQVERKN